MLSAEDSMFYTVKSLIEVRETEVDIWPLFIALVVMYTALSGLVRQDQPLKNPYCAVPMSCFHFRCDIISNELEHLAGD